MKEFAQTGRRGGNGVQCIKAKVYVALEKNVLINQQFITQVQCLRERGVQDNVIFDGGV